MIASSATRLLWLSPATLLLSATPPPVLSVQVVKQDGMPLRDAGIEAMPPAGDRCRPVFRWCNAMAQKDISFLPGSLIVPRGAVGAFRNLDNVRHSIYSFSKPGPFKIDLYGWDQTRTQQFKISGTIALGCNIDDQMRGYIPVTDTPYAARSDPNGQASIEALCRGTHDVVVWHRGMLVAGGEWLCSQLLPMSDQPLCRAALRARMSAARFPIWSAPG